MKFPNLIFLASLTKSSKRFLKKIINCWSLPRILQSFSSLKSHFSRRILCPPCLRRFFCLFRSIRIFFSHKMSFFYFICFLDFTEICLNHWILFPPPKNFIIKSIIFKKHNLFISFFIWIQKYFWTLNWNHEKVLIFFKIY